MLVKFIFRGKGREEGSKGAGGKKRSSDGARERGSEHYLILRQLKQIASPAHTFAPFGKFRVGFGV
jgi:hypothetical protein